MNIVLLITINKASIKLSFHENMSKVSLKNIKLSTKYNYIII